MIMGILSFGVSAEGPVRKPAVAGKFYEENPKLLRTVILRYLADGTSLGEPVRLLICPHAGFVFSGPVAAKGYATIASNAKRVFIVGPSHYEAFRGMAVPEFEYYETPLGKVKIDRDVISRLRKNPAVVSSSGFDQPEHCLEVQLPFLQVQLSDFSIVPILTGAIDPKTAADLLYPFFDDTTVIIASSDLSHFKKQMTARKIDDRSITTILAGDLNGPIDACGEIPIRIVMHIAGMAGLTPLKLDARTSYETAPEHCDNSRVVGYVSVAYVTESTAAGISGKAERRSGNGEEYSGALRKKLLHIARQSLEASVRGKKYAPPTDLPACVKEHRGCFVTLTVDGALRGCIGYIDPIKPLYQAVVENASNAALSDPRFPKVTPGELDGIRIEISVLTTPEKLEYRDPDDLLDKLVPGRDGVILMKGGRHSTYLPQVWEQLPDKVRFLEQLSLKGGMDRNGWKSAEVRTYRAIHFNE